MSRMTWIWVWKGTKDEELQKKKISRAFIEKSNLHYSCKSYKRILLPIFFFFFSINSYQLVVNWFGMCNKTLGLWVYLAR